MERNALVLFGLFAQIWMMLFLLVWYLAGGGLSLFGYTTMTGIALGAYLAYEMFRSGIKKQAWMTLIVTILVAIMAAALSVA